MQDSKTLKEFQTMLGYDMFLKYSSIDYSKVNENSTDEDLDELFTNKTSEVLFESHNQGIRFIDTMDVFTTLNEDDCSWTSLNEDDRWVMENDIWYAVAAYMSVDASTINEGFWSGVLSGLKDAGKKAYELAKKTVAAMGGLFQRVIKAFKGIVKALCQKGIEMGKKIGATIQGMAEGRMQRMQKHSTEMVEKDVSDLGATTDWLSGKGPEGLVGEGSSKAAAAVAGAIKGDSEGEKEVMDKIKELEKDAKGGQQQAKQQPKKPAQPASPKRESFDLTTYGVDAEMYESSIQFINQFREGADSELYEQTYEIISEHVHDSQIYEGAFENTEELNELFGLFKKKDKKLDKPETDAGKDKEQELLDKDKEKEAEAKKNIPDVGDPKGEAQSRMEDAAEDKDGSKWLSWITKVRKIAIGGLVALAEMLLEPMFRGTFKGVSAVVKSFGGPGVFVFAVIAAGLTVLCGLAMEVYASFGVGEDAGEIAQLFSAAVHMSGLLPGVVYALATVAKNAFPGAKTTIKAIGVGIAVYMGIQHVKHYLTIEGHSGPMLDHKKAIKIEEKQIKEDEEEINSTDNEELKKLLEARKENNIKLSQAHEKMIPLDEKFLELDEKKLPEAKKAVKTAKSGLSGVLGKGNMEKLEKAKEKVENLKDTVKGLDKSLKQAKEELQKYQDADEKGDDGMLGKNDISDAEDAIKKIEKAKVDLPKALEKAQAEYDELKKKSEGNDSAEAAQEEWENALKELHHLEHEIHHLGDKLKKKKEEVLGPLLDKKQALAKDIKKARAKNENYEYDINQPSFRTFESFVTEEEDPEFAVYRLKELNAFRNRSAIVAEELEAFFQKIENR